MTDRSHPAPDPRVAREAAWDRFIDELDRCGQAGNVTDVTIPAFGLDGLEGRRFSELTRVDVQQLERVAASLGRRAETVKVLWEDAQRQKRNAAKPKKSRKS